MGKIINFSERKRQLEKDRETMKEIEALASMSEEEYKEFRRSRFFEICDDPEMIKKFEDISDCPVTTYWKLFMMKKGLYSPADEDEAKILMDLENKINQLSNI